MSKLTIEEMQKAIDGRGYVCDAIVNASMKEAVSRGLNSKDAYILLAYNLLQVKCSLEQELVNMHLNSSPRMFSE